MRNYTIIMFIWKLGGGGPKVNVLIDGDLGGDLRPQAGVFHRCHGFLGVTIHMHVQHETTEGSTQVIGQILI